MADLVITRRYQLSKDGITFDSGTIRDEIDLSSGRFVKKIVVVGTSEEDIDLTDITLPAIVTLRLITADVTVTYGPKISGPAIETLAKLSNDRKNAEIGLESGETLRVVASAANTEIEVFAVGTAT